MVYRCAIHSSPIHRATIPVVTREVRDDAERTKANAYMDGHLFFLPESRHMGPIGNSQHTPGGAYPPFTVPKITDSVDG